MNLSLSVLDWVVFSFVMIGSMSFGLWMAYRKKAGENSSNFFLGGRKIAWPIVGASIFATNIGAEHLVGLSGDSYRYGLSAGSVELTTAITLGFACAILFPYYIKNKIFTIPEFLELRYDRRARTFFSGLMLIISIMTKLAFTLFAGALVLNSILGRSLFSNKTKVCLVSSPWSSLGYKAKAITPGRAKMKMGNSFRKVANMAPHLAFFRSGADKARCTFTWSIPQ